MIRDAFPDAGERDPASLRAAYADRLAEALSSAGPERVRAQTDLDGAAIEAIRTGDVADLSLAEAAAVLAVARDRDADAVAADARDLLLIGMTNAVLDVDRVASGLDGAMDAKTIQQKLEGRQPLTLDEYARLHHYIAAEGP